MVSINKFFSTISFRSAKKNVSYAPHMQLHRELASEKVKRARWIVSVAVVDGTVYVCAETLTFVDCEVVTTDANNDLVVD